MKELYDDYDAKSHMRALESRKYNKERVIKEEAVGDWIVTLEKYGTHEFICKSYNRKTLYEHYRYFIPISRVLNDAPKEIKGFYEKSQDSVFGSVLELARKWNEEKNIA